MITAFSILDALSVVQATIFLVMPLVSDTFCNSLGMFSAVALSLNLKIDNKDHLRLQFASVKCVVF